MTKIDDGGPAFPVPGLQQDADFNGMTLRDWFAAQAMAAIISLGNNYTYTERVTHSVEAAGDAYEMADAMLAARKQS